jgi:hypothetical protein
MSFISSFEKIADPVADAVAIDRSDITMAEGGSGANASGKARKVSAGNSQRNRESGQNKSGILTHSFSAEKEVDPDRFPHKSWQNSRQPG